MSKVKFTVKENNAVGTHSFYGVPVFTGTLTSEELLEKALKNTSYEVSMAQGILKEYMKTVQEFLLMGYRCQLGENFLFVYPNIQLSVKDELNQDGTVKKVATEDMIKTSMAIGKVGCTVSSKFSKRFDMEVSWTKTDKNGNELTEEDATEGNKNVENGSDNTQTPSGNGDNPSGGDGNGGGGNNNGGVSND